jgi:NhaP-type Na+/H+ or K+/H+ antiporter
MNHEVPGAEQLALVVLCTVLISIVVHGVSANPLSRALAARIRDSDGQ